MAKLNWERISKQNHQRRQPNVNFDKKSKKSRLQKLWAHAIETETKFLSGRYWNQDIKGVIEMDPAYCEWILTNQPTGVIAKQIIRHFNR